MKPVVSVLIDTYNHERYIEQAIVSVIEQDFPGDEYEILVVDDGSTDRTPEIVQKFAPRVRLLRKKNGGQASAFNLAFPQLRGEIVSFLDGDDWWAKGKVSAVLYNFERHPDDSAVSHGHYEVREEQGETRLRGPEHEVMLDLGTPEAAAVAREHWHLLLPCALTVRRNLLDEIGPIPEELVFSADGPIATASMSVGIRVLDKPLSFYRVHAGNLNAIDGRDVMKMRRKLEMGITMYDIVEPMLIQRGVPPRCVEALLDPPWIEVNRAILSRFGGRRLRTLRTEIRNFRHECKEPTARYRLFKHMVVGAAAIALPPRFFYRARDWYGRKGLGRFREQVARAGKARIKV